MGRIFNFGSFCLDTLLTVPHIVAPGETLGSTTMRQLPGGKGANQSLAAARAGGRVVHIGRVGEDGAHLRALLADAGIDVSHVHVDPHGPTGQAIVQVAMDGENAIVIVPGANRGLPPNFLDGPLADLGAGDWLLLQNETDLVPEAIALGGASAASVALNLAPADVAARCWPLECVDLFILNETEAQALTGAHAVDAQLQALAARAPAAMVALTFGARGALLATGPRHATPDLRFEQGAYSVQVVDTTGAGDAFTGSLLAALAAALPLPDALARAAGAGALACTRIGAAVAMPLAAEVDALRAAQP